jgi:hypothetical protein
MSYRVFANLGRQPHPFEYAWHPLLALRPPSESSRLPAADDFHRTPKNTACSTTSSHEVSFPFSVSPHKAAACWLARLASPNRLHLQVFSTSWRLCPPRAWWPCFMPHPLLGLRPSELCSFRAAVRRLQRLCPLVVKANPNHASRAPQTAETDHRALHCSAPTTEVAEHRPKPVTAGRNHLHPNSFRNRPGSAPAFRALLHTKVRHPTSAV